MRCRSFSRCLAFSAFSVAVCYAQGTARPGAGAGSTGGGTTTTGGTTGTTTSIPSRTGNTTGDTSNTIPRPIYVAGKVITSDGTVPDQAVLIERVCGSRTYNEGYTDRKGRFSIELGHDQTMLADASSTPMGSMNRTSSSRNTMGGNSNTVTERNLVGCELRANLPGFRSSTVSLTQRRSMDNPDVGTLILKRMGNVEGLTISATSVNAPKDARKAFDKGHDALQKGKFDDAAKQLDKAVELYPQYAMAWFDRGRVFEGKSQIDDAKRSYSEALKADPKLLQPYDRLAALAVQNREWQDAAEISDRMIRLNPYDFPQAYLFNAIANLNLQKLDPAEKSATELIKNDTTHHYPGIEHVMAVILAKKQDFEGSAKHFRTFIEVADPGPGVEAAKKQLAEIEKTLAAQRQ